MIEVIAEIGWNFVGDMSLAKEMVQAAKESGASTVKFQVWDPDRLKSGPWDLDGRRQIYEKAVLTDEKILYLERIALDLGIDCLFSAFNVEDARRLSDLGARRIKIPSHEVYNSELLIFSSDKFAEVIVSTGAAVSDEVKQAVDIVTMKTKANFMHCVSSYPCEIQDINLPRLKWLEGLGVETGLSDHTGSLITGALAVSLGVKKIEKHFTVDNSLPGRDNKFALEPFLFSNYVKNINEAEMAMIDKGVDLQQSELDIFKNYRGRWSREKS